jgi:cation transport ATPase
VFPLACSAGAVHAFVAMMFVFTILVQQRYLFLFQCCSLKNDEGLNPTTSRTNPYNNCMIIVVSIIIIACNCPFRDALNLFKLNTS